MVRESTVVTLRNNPRRYNVLYGREYLQKDVGAFTILKRAINQGGLVTHEPRTMNAIGEISEFLYKNKNKKIDDITIINADDRPNLFKLLYKYKTLRIDGDDHDYKLYTRGNDYHLWIPSRNRLVYRHLHIKAGDAIAFKQKLHSLLNDVTTQAKLEFYKSNIMPGLANIHIPGAPTHTIFLDESRLTSAYSENAYTPIGIDGKIEQFDSQLGSVDHKQMTYFAPLTTFEGYSRQKKKPVKIQDETWIKSHEAAQYVNASNDCAELLETIIAQTYSGQTINPKLTAQMITRLKEDFIHNLYGFGTLNVHSKGQALLPFGDTPKRWQGVNDPLRGGRVWHEHAPSNQEIASIMYVPQIDGTAKLRFDTDKPEDKKILRSLIERLKIYPKDRQYMMNYARKALGIKIAMKFIQEELAQIRLDDPIISPMQKQHNRKKWQELTFIKDQLFNNAGDLRDSLRKGNVGFSAYAVAVGATNLPPLKKNPGFYSEGIPNKEGFAKAATAGLGDITENYPYFENIWGWQGREYLAGSINKILTQQLFNHKVPQIVADNAVIMLLETIDRTGRRLKLFNDLYDRDASLSSLSKKFINRLGRADFIGANDTLRRQKKRWKQLFKGKQDFSDTAVKRLALQGEGVMFEGEVFPTDKGDYMGDNNGLLYASNLSSNNLIAGYDGFMHHLHWRETDKMASKFLPTMIDLARFMKAHQADVLYHQQYKLLNQSNADHKKAAQTLEHIYKSPMMLELDNAIKAAAHEMALNYFEKNKEVFNDGPDADLKLLFNHVKIEFTNVLQMLANVVAMTARNRNNIKKT